MVFSLDFIIHSHITGRVVSSAKLYDRTARLVEDTILLFSRAEVVSGLDLVVGSAACLVSRFFSSPGSFRWQHRCARGQGSCATLLSSSAGSSASKRM